MSNVDTLRPKSLAGFVGQELLKERLMIHITAALNDKRLMEHVLLMGPPGFGKTTLAGAIAWELAEPFAVIQMPFKDADYRLLRRFKGVVLLDEIHAAPRSQQEDLQRLLESGELAARRGPAIRPTWLTIIAATTEPSRVIKPLRQRFPVDPFLEDYRSEDLALVVGGMAEMAGLDLSTGMAAELGAAAGFVPRQARKLILMTRDMLSTNGTMPSAGEVLAQCRLEPDGLNPDHLAYIRLLFDMDQPLGLASLRNMLDRDAATIQEDERLLFRLGLISRSPQGRELTAAGYERAEQLMNREGVNA